MKRVVLSELTRQEDVALVAEIKRIDKEKGKVYRMMVHNSNGSEPDTFLTTSKDLFLELGRLTLEAQQGLAQLIHRELANGQFPFVLLIASEKVGEGSGGILASVGFGEDHMPIIHLAKAN